MCQRVLSIKWRVPGGMGERREEREREESARREERVRRED